MTEPSGFSYSGLLSTSDAATILIGIASTTPLTVVYERPNKQRYVEVEDQSGVTMRMWQPPGREP